MMSKRTLRAAALSCACLAACATLETPKVTFDEGDYAEIAEGDLAGLVGRVVAYEPDRSYYTLEFDDRRTTRKFYWKQLLKYPRKTLAFAENDMVEVVKGALAGRVGRITRVNALYDEYALAFDEGVHEARRFRADELRAWSPAVVTASAAARPRAAVVPFRGAGLDADSGETLAWHLANLPDIGRTYTVVPSTPNIRSKTNDELLLDYNHIYYGPALDAADRAEADYVFAGYICRAGAKALVLIVMLDAKTGRLVAGDYQPYLNAQQIPQLFPSMARKIIAAAAKNTGEKPKLAVRGIAVPEAGVAPGDADVLSSLLACDLASLGAYAVFPRDPLPEAAARPPPKKEGDGEAAAPGRTALTKADYVLSGKIALLNTKNQFLAEVVRVENSYLKSGMSVDFGTIEDAVSKMRSLAGSLSAAQ